MSDSLQVKRQRIGPMKRLGVNVPGAWTTRSVTARPAIPGAVAQCTRLI